MVKTQEAPDIDENVISWDKETLTHAGYIQTDEDWQAFCEVLNDAVQQYFGELGFGY